jgi:hypothetical protein
VASSKRAGRSGGLSMGAGGSQGTGGSKEWAVHGSRRSEGTGGSEGTGSSSGLGYSTVTDLARLRGWSTSCPLAAASSQANTCSGTVATSGCISVGTAGSMIRVSA